MGLKTEQRLNERLEHAVCLQDSTEADYATTTDQLDSQIDASMGTLSVRKCFLRPLDGLRRNGRSAALLLNGTCDWSSLWRSIWNNSIYRVCTDGAGNSLEGLVSAEGKKVCRVFGFRSRKQQGYCATVELEKCGKGGYENNELGVTQFLNGLLSMIRSEKVKQPDVLCGDFDSITDHSLRFFKSSGVHVQPTPDQNYTDMFKALMLIAKEIKQKRIAADRVLVLGGLSGRIDHTLSSFQSLLLFRTICDCPIYIIDGTNIATVITEGVSELHFDDSLSLTTGTAGFIPFCQKRTVVTSKGFKWDLKNKLMEFGGCISTSNKIENELVTIDSTAPLIFTLELSPFGIEI